jgi:hypothetical protein
MHYLFNAFGILKAQLARSVVLVINDSYSGLTVLLSCI